MLLFGNRLLEPVSHLHSSRLGNRFAGTGHKKSIGSFSGFDSAFWIVPLALAVTAPPYRAKRIAVKIKTSENSACRSICLGLSEWEEYQEL
jgi:hypothetical protein